MHNYLLNNYIEYVIIYVLNIRKGIKMTFSDKVKYVRKEMKFSQEQLARKLQISFATVNRWESGKFNPSRMAVRLFDEFCSNQKISFKESVDE